MGTNHFDLDASCKRSSLAYPALVAAAKGYTLNFQACSRATTTDVINNQVSALNSGTNLVTVTAGGNDLGFTSLLVNCTLTNCVSSINSTITSANTTLAPKLDAMDAQIKSHAPNATVIVLGYPRLFSGTCLKRVRDQLLRSHGVEQPRRHDRERHPDGSEEVRLHLQERRRPVHESRCVRERAWLNGLNLGSLTDSYHPTATGYSSGYTPIVRSVTG